MTNKSDEIIPYFIASTKVNRSVSSFRF